MSTPLRRQNSILSLLAPLCRQELSLRALLSMSDMPGGALMKATRKVSLVSTRALLLSEILARKWLYILALEVPPVETTR